MRSQSILLFLLLFMLGKASFSQKEIVSYPPWQHPVLLALEKKSSAVTALPHGPEDDYYVPLAILNKINHRLYYINTFGIVFDSIPVAPDLFAQLAARKIDAFDVYTKLVTAKQLTELYAMKNLLRAKAIPPDKLDPKKTFIDYSSLNETSSELGQMMLLDNIEKNIWQNHLLVNLVLKEKTDSVFLIKKNKWENFKPVRISLHGKDSIEYVEYSCGNRFSQLPKAILQPATATVFLYNQQDIIIDSFTINKYRQTEFADQKHDVFALYRIWLEYQLQNIKRRLASIDSAAKALNTASAAQQEQVNYLLNYRQFVQKKMLYANKPDNDLLLIHALELCKESMRKNGRQHKHGKICLCHRQYSPWYRKALPGA